MGNTLSFTLTLIYWELSGYKFKLIGTGYLKINCFCYLVLFYTIIFIVNDSSFITYSGISAIKSISLIELNVFFTYP